jgi:hypothetical protein
MTPEKFNEILADWKDDLATGRFENEEVQKRRRAPLTSEEIVAIKNSTKPWKHIVTRYQVSLETIKKARAGHFDHRIKQNSEAN